MAGQTRTTAFIGFALMEALALIGFVLAFIL
jgi:F0F1-type ATP synthase membrane subunit c/vacuolar-type H+-ATPase subunit K